MAVNIDTVYQRVLAISNKEQRGYITPQEFNLFANQAQMEIVEQYFYDINQFDRLHGNHTDYSNMLSLLNEKLGVFKTETELPLVDENGTPDPNGKTDVPIDLLKLGRVFINGLEAEEVKYSDVLTMNNTSICKPKASTPLYTVLEGRIKAWAAVNTNINVTYIRRPKQAIWGYVVVNEKAMYDGSQTQDFELHPLEESELVYKILTLAGITLNKADLSSAAAALQTAKVQQEKI
jgi:hypothetical protein